MNIKPPGTPQQVEHQPVLHTFIGDTPQRPEPSDLEQREASFSAIRAYGELHETIAGSGTDYGDADALDIRTAPTELQANWVNLSV